MSKVIGSLVARITAETSGLQQGARRGASSLQNFGKQARATANRVGAIGVAGAAAGAALVANLTRRGLEAVDAQAKLARQLDGTIDGLRGLQLAGEDAGVSSSTLNKAVENLNARLGEAERGTGTAAGALERLGLNAEDLSAMDVDERMATIADRMQDMGLSGAQAADELRQLGIRNGEMVNLLRQGGDAIRDATTEIQAMGLSLSDVDAAKVEQANDAMSRIGMITEGLQQQFAVKFAPILQGIAELITENAKEFGGLGSIAERVVEFLISGAGFAADAFRGLQVVAKGIQLAFSGVGTAVVAVSTTINEALVGVLHGAVTAGKNLVQFFNNIPGVDIPTGGIENFESRIAGTRQGLLDMRSAAVESTKRIAGEMHDLATKPMPSEALDGFVAQVREKSQEAAEAAQESGVRDALLPDEDATDEALEREREQRRAHLEGMLEDLRTGFMSERELREEEHEHKMEQLREALELELLTQREFEEKAEMLEAQHMAEMERLRKDGMDAMEDTTKKSFDDQASAAEQGLQRMSGAVEDQSKTMFDITKAGAIASALVNTYKGISNTLAEYPWPLSGVLAATHAAAGFANVSNIKSQSFGSSGGSASAPASAASAGGGGGGAGGGGDGASESPPQPVTINATGQAFDDAHIEQVARGLERASQDGRRLDVTVNRL